MNEKSCVLSIDIGTSSVRAAIFDTCGRQIGPCAQHGYPLATGHDGSATIQPDELLKELCRVIDEALAAKEGKLAIDAVGLSTFWHSLVGLDERTAPTTPVWTWADRRAANRARSLRARLGSGLHESTGCPIHSSFWLSRLPWLRDSDKNTYASTATWCSAIDFLMHRLFGELKTSVSMASGTGLFDLDQPRWNAEALSVAEIGEGSLPEVSDSPYRGLRSEYAGRWPQLAGIPWFPAAGDGACSNIGSGCHTRDSLVLMLGTSGSMRMLWDAGRPRLPDPALWCFRLDAKRFAGGMALSEGGASAAWARRLVAEEARRDVDEEIAAMPPDAHGLTVLPFFLGARSPDWIDGRTACIAGITAATTPLEIYRATLESIGLRFAVLKKRLDRAWPDEKRIVATGAGLVRSPVWSQIVADCLGREIELSGVEEGSLRGAALLAWERLGAAPLGRFGYPIDRVVSPDAEAHSRYAEAMERQEAFDRLLHLQQAG
ncbi:gluconokinase [Propionivibrio sp.]|uniref:gluconokinase n=1 Tax=Propionivibrio sp. TaxID=2212460 RepID=UPI0039E44588